jgi:hypothetical protein
MTNVRIIRLAGFTVGTTSYGSTMRMDRLPTMLLHVLVHKRIMYARPTGGPTPV